MTDAELLSAFEACTLSASAWTHEAHVRVAWLHLQRTSCRDAASRMAAGIKRLNASLGVVDGPDSGFHATVTEAFMRLIAAASREDSSEDSRAFCRGHPELMRKCVLLEYYSRERIMADAAKRGFVPPDLKALPGFE